MNPNIALRKASWSIVSTFNRSFHFPAKLFLNTMNPNIALHGQSVQHRLVRIDGTLFGLIQLTIIAKHHGQLVTMLPCSNRCDDIRFDSIDTLSSQSVMLNWFNVILIESIRCNSVRFNWLTIIAKHHGQSVQRRLVRIDATIFGLIQLTHYHRKASWSIGSTSPCSNRCDAIRFDSIDTLSSQSIMVNRFNVALLSFDSMSIQLIWYIDNWIDTITLSQRIMVIWLNINTIDSMSDPINLIYTQLNRYKLRPNWFETYAFN